MLTCFFFVKFTVLPLYDLHRKQVHDQSNNRNTKRRYQMCSKLTIKTLERRWWCIWHFLMFLSLTWNRLIFAGYFGFWWLEVACTYSFSKSRGVFKTQPKIYNGVFCENSKRFLAVIRFRRNLYHKCLIVF